LCGRAVKARKAGLFAAAVIATVAVAAAAAVIVAIAAIIVLVVSGMPVRHDFHVYQCL
jgi:hypothetical protein